MADKPHYRVLYPGPKVNLAVWLNKLHNEGYGNPRVVPAYSDEDGTVYPAIILSLKGDSH